MTLDLPDFTKGMGGIDKDGNPLQFFHKPPVWFHDDFEAGIFKWGQNAGTVTHDSTSASGATESPVYNGAGCMKIVSPTGAAGTAIRSIGVPPVSNNIAMSMIFEIDDKANYDATIGNGFEAQIWYYDNTYLSITSLSYTPTTGKWYVYDDATSAWVEVLDHTIIHSVPHYFKLVINLSTFKYAKLYVDEASADISSYTINKVASAIGSYFAVYIHAFGAAGKSATLYVDDFKVTFNEP